MAILPQNPRDQKVLAIGIVAIALAVVYQQLVWTPKNVELNSLEVRLDTLDSLNKVARAEYAKGNAAKMKAEADQFARELAVLRRLVPTENEVPALLDAISSAARRAGLEISDVQPDGVINGDSYDTYKYKLGVTGPYHQVSQFLTNIGSMSRIVVPINLTLTPTSRVGELRPKKDQQLLDARFGVETYVVHGSVKAPGAVGAGRTGAP